MPIQPLSNATSRVLTSTQTLDNATSVVKELVDNALDSRASSISVEIAPNTLDRIIVKDDGSGIGIEDRQLLCRRGHTSKIVDLDDLAKLGGTFLGFRGTALASIADLSQQVTIITKVEGEQTGTSLTFASDGRLLSSASASHNDGTTVRVEHFLASIPVRRQMVLKNPSKVLEDIKKLLQAYAIARPTVKLSLKVLKSKTDKFNWSFAACKGEDLLSAATVQVVGKFIAQLCIAKSLKSDGGSESYGIEALLLAQDKELLNASIGAQFISVDGRPVSQEKGIMKSLVKTYKSYLQHAKMSDRDVPSKPFFVLHLLCPTGSYDVNVEPAKDVVLFHNELEIFALVEKMLIECYGERERSQTDRTGKQYSKSPTNPNLASFNVLLARKRPVNESQDQSTDLESPRLSEQRASSPENILCGNNLLVNQFAEAVQSSPGMSNSLTQLGPFPPIPNPFATSRPSYNMYARDEELLDLELATQNDLDTRERVERCNPANVATNNPFIRAKTHSILPPKKFRTEVSRRSNACHSGEISEKTFSSSSSMGAISSPPTRVLSARVHPLPTPETSPMSRNVQPYQNPGPPFPRRSKRTHEDEGNGEDIVTGAIGERSEPKPALASPLQQSMLGNWVELPATRTTAGFRSASEVPRAGADVPNKPQIQGVETPPLSKGIVESIGVFNKPFRSPLRPTSPSRSSSAHSVPSDRGFDTMDSAKTLTPFPATTGVDDDLQYILDFERKKKTVNQRQRLSQAVLDPTGLATIQRRSLTKLPYDSSGSPQPGSEAGGMLQTDLIRGIARLSDGSPSYQLTTSESNPHRNRYIAAVRNLQPSSEQAQSKSNMSPNSSAELGEIEPMSATDPRSYLISLRRSHPGEVLSTLKIKRSKTSRLPFEAIPADEVKHDLLAVPMDSFPLSQSLSSSTASLATVDPYTQTGKIDSQAWLSKDEEVHLWQKEIERLVKRIFRATTHNGEENEQEQHLIPNLDVPLAKILKTHLDSIC